MKRTVTNTTKVVQENPLIGLMTAMPGGIEASEARGQHELVNSEVLPTQGSDDPAWAKMGVIFGEPVEGDPIFRSVTLPVGWKKEVTDHAMWNKLLDDKGRERGTFFYKAAFYDRRAHISVSGRFGIRRVFGEKYDPKEPMQHEVIDGGARVVATAREDVPEAAPFGSDAYRERDAVEKRQQAECEAWLAARYPEWKDPTAHWDSP